MSGVRLRPHRQKPKRLQKRLPLRLLSGRHVDQQSSFVNENLTFYRLLQSEGSRLIYSSMPYTLLSEPYATCLHPLMPHASLFTLNVLACSVCPLSVCTGTRYSASLSLHTLSAPKLFVGPVRRRGEVLVAARVVFRSVATQ